MNSKTAIFYFVATLLVAHAQDNEEKSKPQAGCILGGGNSEFGVGSHIFYVTYPGMKDEKAGSMVIRLNETTIHTYNFKDEEEVQKPYTFFFAIKGTTDKIGYTVKFCRADGITCSEPSSPPTVMDNGEGELDCLEKDSNVKNITIPAVSKYADETELANYKTLRNGKSIAEIQGITKNPSYKSKEDGKGFMYFLVNYELSAFKKLFQAQGDEEEKYCQAKYTFMVITQVFDKTTKRILKRGRFTPKPLTNPEHIKKYITGEAPEDVPIEFTLDISQEDAKKENLMIWQSVCVSAKDKVSSREDGFTTKCSEPLPRDWNWESDGENE